MEILSGLRFGILNQGDFFGEGCLTGQRLRLCSATAMTDCSVMKIEKKSMVEVLHRQQAFSDMFVAYLLTRNIRYEEDLVDQLFNSSEKRALNENLDKCASYAAFWKATNSVLVAAKRCAFSSR